MSTNIHGAQGDVVGAGIDGSGNIVGKTVTINGSVIQLINPSAEALAALQTVNAIPTAVAPNSDGGIPGSTTAQDSPALQRRIDELLALLKPADGPGRRPQEISGGGVHISRTELLLKKAVLIKAEAEQMYFDHLARVKSQYPPEPSHAGGDTQVDLNTMLDGFDEATHAGKLQEAYTLLQEANQLDPANTDVLLNLAQLLIELTPDDPSDEQRLLYRIQRLLSTPKDNTERFRLAQASFLLATRTEPPHAEALRDARQMFEQLGRREWVRQCDDLLRSVDASFGSPPEALPPLVHPSPAPPPIAPFQPQGRWFFRLTDGRASVITVNFHPNGMFGAVQQAGPYAPVVQAQGQWLFNPHTHTLQFQGMVNNFTPFMLGIAIQHAQPNGYYGVGTDSCAYFISRG